MMRKCKHVNFTVEMWKGYEEYLLDEEIRHLTVVKYLRDVKLFLSYLEGIGGEEKEKVREYKQWLLAHYKTSSVNTMLTAVNNFLAYAGREDLKVKLFKIQKGSYSSPEREITEKDYEKLVRKAKENGDEKTSMLLQTIVSTGIRISELKFITVESLEKGRIEIYNQGKARVILLPAELARLLKKYCRRSYLVSGSVFVTKNGNPLDRSNISKKMKKLAREAGVDTGKVFPHNFRHLFARIFYRMEKDIVRLMDLPGHSNINMIRIYTRVTEDQPRRQMLRKKMVLG